MRCIARISIAIVLFSLVVSGAAAETDLRVSGRVLGPGGKPVAGARVKLLPFRDPVARGRDLLAGGGAGPAVSTAAGSAGTFELRAPRAGVWIVRLEAPGYVPMERGLAPLLESVELEDAELSADAGFIVKVSGSGERPVAGAAVRLWDAVRSQPGAPPSSVWRPARRQDVTDAQGTVRIPRSAKETLALDVSAPGYLVQERAAVEGTSVTLRLEPGEACLVLAATGDGKPAPGVLVASARHEHPIALTDDRGRASVAVPPGGALPVVLIAKDGIRATARVEPASKGRDAPVTITLPVRKSVTGRVIDLLSRLSVAGALVWPPEEPWAATTADHGGVFVIAGPAGKSLSLVAGAPAYLKSDSQRSRLGVGSGPGPVLALQPAAAVEGEVVSADGKPVSGARLRLEILRAGKDKWYFADDADQFPRTSSDAAGRFRLTGADPDHDYLLVASAPRLATATQSIFGLEPRRTRSGIRVVLTPGQMITGTIVNQSDEPLAGAAITLRPSPHGFGLLPNRYRMVQGPGPLRGMTGPAGRFTLTQVPKGTFDLEVSLAGFARVSSLGHMVPESAEPVDLGKFKLEPGERIRGVVADTAGQPIVGVKVRLGSGSGSLMGGADTDASEADALSAPDGGFEVRDLGGGTLVDLSFDRAGYVPFKEPGVRVPHPEPLTVTLVAASRISGAVVGPDDVPVDGAQVKMTRHESEASGRGFTSYVWSSEATTDSGGRFLFEGVEPGRIDLNAVFTGFQTATIEGIEVPKGQDLEGLKLSLKAGAVVSGRVADPDDRPCVGATVRAVPGGSSPFAVMNAPAATTDGGGNYRLEGLPLGRASLEASCRDYVRVAKDLDIELGANTLNFQVQGGQTVAGQVTNSSGSPVIKASISLVTTSQSWGEAEADSGPDGSFRIKGVLDGEYLVHVEAEGYAPFRDGLHVKVAGQPVDGLVIRLGAAATISGALLGLDPMDYANAFVFAQGTTGESGSSGLNHEGKYRIADLGAGEYQLTAGVGSTGRRTTGKVEIEPGMTEAHLDLKFGEGLTIKGHVFLGDAPLKGASIFVQESGGAFAGVTRSDGEGAFRIEGLQAGRYTLNFRQWDLGIVHSESIDLDGDSSDIAVHVPLARIAGRVVDTADKQGLGGVQVSLKPPGEGQNTFFQAHMTATDQDGRFEVGNISDGSWTLAASKEGYAASSLDLVVENGGDRNDLRVEMSSTEGLTLSVRLPTGGFPDSVQAAVLDPSGRVVTQGSFVTRENGAIRLSSVPPGTWDIVLAATGTAASTVHTTSPGGPLALALPPPCALEIGIPALKGTSRVAELAISDDQGRPFRTLNWSGDVASQWTIGADGTEFRTMPPGKWIVRATAPDGTAWQGTVTTSPEKSASIELQ